MVKAKHIILKNPENMENFNKVKSIVVKNKTDVSNVTDELVLEDALKFFIDKNE